MLEEQDFQDLPGDVEKDTLMSKIAFTVVGTCASGDHWIIDASVGGETKQIVIHASELTAPITADELPIIIRYLLRGYGDGKSAAQLKAGAQTGITVNI